MKIFEDFFDNIDNVDMNLDDKIEVEDYNNKILIDINKKFDNSEEEFRTALRKLIYFLEFSNCFSNFRVSIFNKPQMFKNTSEVVVQNISHIDDLNNIELKSNYRVLDFIIEYNLSNASLSFSAVVIFFDKLIKSCFNCVNLDSERNNINHFKRFLSCHLFVNDVECFSNQAIMPNGKLEHLRSDINLLIKIWHTFIGTDAHNIYEKDIVKICKYLHLRNLYGCLLSTLYAVDTTMPDLHITDFIIKSVSGVYSNSRRIFTSALHIDHVKWTEMLNEMVFGHKFESKEMQGYPLHYFVNVQIILPHDASVYMSDYPSVDAYERQNECVYIEYIQSHNNAIIIDGLNAKKFEELATKTNIKLLVKDLDINRSMTFKLHNGSMNVARFVVDIDEINKWGWNLPESNYIYKLEVPDFNKIKITKTKR